MGAPHGITAPDAERLSVIETSQYTQWPEILLFMNYLQHNGIDINFNR